MTDIMKLKVDGVQVYPQTHKSAVVGLEDVAGPKGDKGDKGDPGIQGPKGDKGDKGDAGSPGTNATTTAVATQSVNGLMSAADKKKLDGLNLSFEKVGTV